MLIEMTREKRLDMYVKMLQAYKIEKQKKLSECTGMCTMLIRLCGSDNSDNIGDYPELIQKEPGDCTFYPYWFTIVNPVGIEERIQVLTTAITKCKR